MTYLSQSLVRKTVVFGIILILATAMAVLGVSGAFADESSNKASDNKMERDIGPKGGKHRLSIEKISAKIQEAVERGQLSQAEADEKRTAFHISKTNASDQNKRRPGRSFNSHLSAIKKSYKSVGIPCAKRKSKL